MIETPDIPRGTYIRIPKGTVIRTTHPCYTDKTAARTYTVTLDHIIGATSLPVAHRDYDAEGNVQYESEPQLWHGDVNLVLKRYGTVDLESLREHFVEGPRRLRPDGTSYCSLFLQVLEAEVSWAGSGGYWFRAPVSAVEVLDGDAS